MTFQIGDWVERRNPGRGRRFGRVSGLVREGCYSYYVTGGIGMRYIEAARNLRRVREPYPLPHWAVGLPTSLVVVD